MTSIKMQGEFKKMVADKTVFDKIKGGLIVSCQAFPGEAMYGSQIMAAFARAAEQGGAMGIRANSYDDIVAIKNSVSIPVMGLVKMHYPESDIVITPSEPEIEELIKSRCEVLTVDGSIRRRPEGKSLKEFFKPIREKYPDAVFMADIATIDEAKLAADIGFDCVATTIAGHTTYTRGLQLPAVGLIEELVRTLNVPVIAEGGIRTPENLKQVFEAGAWSAVVGGAITMPKDITMRFVNAISQK